MSVLQNKVVVVTGGASGIGLAVGEPFAADGAKVVIADVKHDAGAPIVDLRGVI
jgi:NAD(P)-dependent dehydrogenase (short-subunit alcohol dehydrogenase family)